MLIDYSVFQPAPAMGAIDKKSALIGAGVGVAAGAGIALAAPAIGSAVAGAGATGILSGIVGGVAAIGGGVLGAVSAFAGAIGGAISAVGGFIAGIFTSPLFIPALVIVGACVAGYFIYKKYKEKKANSKEDNEVLPNSDEITINPGDYAMSTVIPQGDNRPIQVSNEIIKIDGDATNVTVSDEVPVAKSSVTETVDNSGTVNTTVSGSLQEAQTRYIKAYNKYQSIVGRSSSNSTEVQEALREYKEAYNEYSTLKAVGAK